MRRYGLIKAAVISAEQREGPRDGVTGARVSTDSHTFEIVLHFSMGCSSKGLETVLIGEAHAGRFC
jgi:hypothetical protein